MNYIDFFKMFSWLEKFRDNSRQVSAEFPFFSAADRKTRFCDSMVLRIRYVVYLFLRLRVQYENLTINRNITCYVTWNKL